MSEIKKNSTNAIIGKPQFFGINSPNNFQLKDKNNNQKNVETVPEILENNQAFPKEPEKNYLSKKRYVWENDAEELERRRVYSLKFTANDKIIKSDLEEKLRENREFVFLRLVYREKNNPTQLRVKENLS